MPNQCVHCSEKYNDGAEEILKGCSKCGSRFFFYVSQEKYEKLKNSQNEIVDNLSVFEKKQIEQDVREIAGIEDEDAPVVLDFESVKILKPGKYVLDIVNLFNSDRPLVYKLEEGKYIIDLAAQINSLKRKLSFK
jgi:predicted  nucleic acid-binding Zn-ribbon protein